MKYGCMGGGDYFSANYLQSITPRFCMGGEASYIGAQNISVGSYGMRYNGIDWMGSAQWSGQQGALSLHYKKTITKDRVNFGAELQVRLGGREGEERNDEQGLSSHTNSPFSPSHHLRLPQLSILPCLSAPSST